MTTASLDLSTVDLGDFDLWDPRPPYELFAQMRREAPLHWSPLKRFPEEGGFWSVTRYADIKAMTRDYETFSSERRGIVHVDDIGVPLFVQQQQMISMDPPRHDRLKQLVGKAFTPARIASHEEHIRKIVNSVLDRVVDREQFDLVLDVSRPIPARVIGDMCGVPEEDDQKIIDWTNIFTAFEDPLYAPEPGQTDVLFQEVLGYVGDLVEQRRAAPTDDLLTALMDAEVDGEKLNELELPLFFMLLVAAGNDSTRATYSSTMLALMEDPEQYQLLLDRPELIPAAVEEGLRCFPAFPFMGRTATKDVELHGQTIREGDRILMWYLSSNRDETVFSEPERFHIQREDTKEHQAFGAGGRHFCLGVALARLELRVWIEETLRRMPDLELAGEPERMKALFLNQYNTMPVRRRG